MCNGRGWCASKSGTKASLAAISTGRTQRAEQLTQLEQWLLDGPQAHGYPTPLWTCQRVTRLIQEQFGVAYHPGHVWKPLVVAPVVRSPVPGPLRARGHSRPHYVYRKATFIASTKKVCKPLFVGSIPTRTST